MELIKAKSKNNMLLEMQCMVAIERMDPMSLAHQPSSVLKQTESNESRVDCQPDSETQADVCANPLNVVQEEEEIDEPLDLTIGIRKVVDVDTISISDTEEAPIMISDDSDNETGTELRRLHEEDVSISYLLFILVNEDSFCCCKTLFHKQIH